MNFLNPVTLFGIFAAAIPLLIHLLTRTKSRIIPFSSLRFLKQLENQQNRRLRLRQLLLLILRTCIILLLVLAFARPTLRGRLDSALVSDAKSTMALIIDNSISMNRIEAGNTLFDSAKASAEQIVDAMQSGDQVFLLTTTDTSSELSHQNFFDPVALKRAIAGLKINYRMTDFSAALTAAHHRLSQSSDVNKEIYLIADFQESGFHESAEISRPGVHAYAVVKNRKSDVNAALQSLTLKSTILQKGKIAEISAKVANTGRQAIDNVVLQLFVDDNMVAQTDFQLQPGGSAAKIMRFTLERDGFSSAFATIEDDDLLDDNRRDLAFCVPDYIRVGIAGMSAVEMRYLQMALQPEQVATPFFQLATISPSELSREASKPYDVLICDNLDQADEEMAEALAQFIDRGGGVIFILGENTNIRSFNTVLSPKLKLPKLGEMIGTLNSGAFSFSLGEVDLAHPLFSGVFEQEESSFAKPLFRFAISLQQLNDIDVILRYSNGDPFLFEKKRETGRILVITSTLQPQFTDITHRTIFAPLISGLVGYAGAGGIFSPQQVNTGEMLRQKIPQEKINSSFEIVRPDQQFDRVNATMTGNGAWLYYSQTDLPGVYKLLADGTVLQQWTVALDPQESNFSPIGLDALRKQYSLTPLPADADLPDFIKAQRQGTELWKWFIGLALILLVVEMLIYREKGEVTADIQAPGATAGA